MLLCSVSHLRCTVMDDIMCTYKHIHESCPTLKVGSNARSCILRTYSRYVHTSYNIHTFERGPISNICRISVRGVVGTHTERQTRRACSTSPSRNSKRFLRSRAYSAGVEEAHEFKHERFSTRECYGQTRSFSRHTKNTAVTWRRMIRTVQRSSGNWNPGLTCTQLTANDHFSAPSCAALSLKTPIRDSGVSP